MDFNLKGQRDESTTDDAKVSEDLYLRYKGGHRADWITGVDDDRAVYNGILWKEADGKKVESRGEIPHDIPLVTPRIEFLVSLLTANRPRFNATARENSDVALTSSVADLGAYIWDYSAGNQEIIRAATDFEVDGVGILHGYVDPYADNGNGEICIVSLDPKTVLIDPNAKKADASDAQHVLIADELTYEQVQDKYPDFDFNGASQSDGIQTTHTRYDGQSDHAIMDINDSNHKKYLVIDRYSKVKDTLFHVFDPNSNFERTLNKIEYQEFQKKPGFICTSLNPDGTPTEQQRYITEEREVQRFTEIFQQTGGVYHFEELNGMPEIAPGLESPMSIPNSTIALQPVVMDDFLKMGIIVEDHPILTRWQRVLTIGKKLYRKYIIESEWAPFGFAMNHHNRNPYPYGDIRQVKGLNEHIVKTESMITRHLANASGPTVLIQKDSADREKLQEQLGKSGVKVVEVDMELGAPVLWQPISLSAELYNNIEKKDKQIQSILGVWDFQSGDATAAPDTYKGTLTIDEMGQRRVRLKKDKIEGMINQLFWWVTDMIPRVYTERKMIKIVEPNHRKMKEVVFNEPVYDGSGTLKTLKNDLVNNRYDIICLSGSMMPTNRIGQMQLLLEMKDRQVLMNNRPILERLDLPNLDQIIEEEDIITRLQQQLGQMQEEIKGLKGDLQTAQRGEVEANKKVAVKDFEVKLDKAYNKIDSSVQLTQQRLTDTVKNKKSDQSKKSQGK
jgi:hypothetical protein